MPQVVSFRPLIAKSRRRYPASTFEVCRGQSCNGTVLSPSFRSSSGSNISHTFYSSNTDAVKYKKLTGSLNKISLSVLTSAYAQRSVSIQSINQIHMKVCTEPVQSVWVVEMSVKLVPSLGCAFWTAKRLLVSCRMRGCVSGTGSFPISSHVSDRYTTHVTDLSTNTSTVYFVARNKKQESTAPFCLPSKVPLLFYTHTHIYISWHVIKRKLCWFHTA
jgi:hypothetical protein